MYREIILESAFNILVYSNFMYPLSLVDVQ